MFKRLLDIFLSLIGIVLFLPFFPIIAILIKFDSKGPIFFLCDRIGKDHQLFKMYKFRTMRLNVDPFGPSPRGAGDPRLTRDTTAVREDFEASYENLYGLRLEDMEVEVVSWRVSALGPAPRRTAAAVA